MDKIRAVILRNELRDDHTLWVKACDDFRKQIEYRIVNLTSNNWLLEIQKLPFDILLAKPGGLTAHFKQLYDERIFILSYILGYKLFPSPVEIFLYENKRFLSYWLIANDIAHPSTNVFYEQVEALDFLVRVGYPIVAKTNIGASGSGVKILRNSESALRYIKDTFSGKGSPQRTGPNVEKGGILKRGLDYLVYPSRILKKIDVYQTRSMNLQKGFVIFQDYIPHDFEWRVVRIGESFFAHKKLKIGDKSSGSLLKNYGNPPLSVLDFVKELTNRHGFLSVAVDLFESERGYLVNEIQCIFGQSDPYQMLVDNRPGRYTFKNNNWVFEEGDFANNACYNLRVEFLLNHTAWFNSILKK